MEQAHVISVHRDAGALLEQFSALIVLQGVFLVTIKLQSQSMTLLAIVLYVHLGNIAALQLLLVVSFHSMRARSALGMFVLLSLSIFAVVGYAVVYRRVVQLRLRPLAATIVLFVVGLLAWNADQEKLGATCDPDSWIQGHAAWHVLTCFAIVTLYTYFRTERALAYGDGAGGSGHGGGDSETCHRVHEPAVAAVVPVHGHEDV